MKQIAFLLIALSLLTFSFCKRSKPTIGIRIKTTLPLPGKQGDYTYVNWYDVYHSDDLSLYRVTVYVDSSLTHILSGKEEYFIKDEIRYRYFVFAKDSLFGISYSMVDRRQGIEISRVTVDSIIKLCNTKFEISPDENGKKWMPDSMHVNSEKELVNTYVFKKTKDYPEDFVYYYYYSEKFNAIPETFTKSYDTIKGMKLFKIAAHGSGAYYEKEKFQMPARTYIYEMEKVSAKDIDSANIFFEKYRKYMKSNHLADL